MRIDLLDMGKTKYGDCVLVREANRSILIDGAHEGDAESIRSQLERLLGSEPPFAVDLLIVTHCHNDHIGCLPALVNAGDLTARMALVADEKLGWGRDANGDSPVDHLPHAQRALVTALQEEDYSDLPEDELEEMILQDVTLEERYTSMLDQLADQGTKVVRYGTAKQADLRAIEQEFQEFGLEILGPTTDHLILCAEGLASATDSLVDALSDRFVSDQVDATALANTYRRLVRRMVADSEFATDRAGPGAAKNNQSIVLKVQAGGWSALLAGDMQFAKAEVPNLTPLMRDLREKVRQAGPYDFIKLTHHTSYNAINEAIMDDWASTTLFAHTGGRNDAGHPEEGVLDLLKSRRSSLTFARTDRNGIITVQKNGAVKMTPSKGRLNDFTPNQPPDEPAESAALEARAQRRGDWIEVHARVPHQETAVTLSIKVEPGAAEPARLGLSTPARARSPQRPREPEERRTESRGTDFRLSDGARLNDLLFVTSAPRLGANIGKDETQLVFNRLRELQGVEIVSLPPDVNDAQEAAAVVRPRLATGKFKGVVLLGGFDVVPSHRLNVLDEAARKAIESAGMDGEDADDFIVWSDDLYGDADGDFMPELPVSRIPDGRKREVVFGALGAPRFTPGKRFAIGNLHRPFAEKVFPNLPGRGSKLEISEMFGPADATTGSAAGAVYFMLHGSARDASRFWGETQGGEPFEAVAIENVPENAIGTVVFTGCCWGGLAVSPPAARVRPGVPLQPRGPEASLAIAYLRAGALAFVGCTGSHYSPLKPPYDYFGKPMHDAFWAAVQAGKSPAQGLFEAKRKFAAGMPHGRSDPFSRGVEVKILRQYTCLGIGW